MLIEAKSVFISIENIEISETMLNSVSKHYIEAIKKYNNEKKLFEIVEYLIIGFESSEIKGYFTLNEKLRTSNLNNLFYEKETYKIQSLKSVASVYKVPFRKSPLNHFLKEELKNKNINNLKLKYSHNIHDTISSYIMEINKTKNVENTNKMINVEQTLESKIRQHIKTLLEEKTKENCQFIYINYFAIDYEDNIYRQLIDRLKNENLFFNTTKFKIKLFTQLYKRIKQLNFNITFKKNNK